MSKLNDFYKRLNRYINDNQNLDIQRINKDTPVAKIKLVDFWFNGHGHFYISSDDDEDSNDLWLSYDCGNNLQYYEPILFDMNIDMVEFYDAVKRLGKSVPKINKFDKSFVIEFSEYEDINEIIGALTYWRDANADCYISCYVDTNLDNSYYMDCSAYTIESDGDYNTRLALIKEQDKKARLKALEIVESDRIKQRELILGDIKRFEGKIKEFRERLDSL